MIRTTGLTAWAGAILFLAFLEVRLPVTVSYDHNADRSQIIVGVSNVQSGPSASLSQNR